MPGKLTLEGQLPAEGATLRQEQLQGNPTQLLNAFETEWEARWDRHKETPDSHWTPFITWFKEAVPPAEEAMPLPPITVEEWRKTVKRKKAKSATGSDGVSKQDLVNLPDDLTQSLLAIVRQVEEGAYWPQAMMEAQVTALAKTVDSPYTSQFRPITVISFVYRVWATIRSRQLIRWLLRFVPSTLIGNLPGRTTANIWYSLQEEIEVAQSEGRDIIGMATDVVKCYNTLPRWPILCLAKHLGVGASLILPWHKCLIQLKRRFRVGAAVSPGLQSTTGFAEGDPLSVCSMILINIAAHHWLRSKVPQVRYLNYVDNLETVGESTTEIRQSFASLDDFCRSLDIDLDGKKTIYWALSAESRKDLKAHGLPVVLAARDLGGHMAYCKRRTNATITARFDQLPLIWSRLARSLANLPQKQLAIMMVAWPRVFHGAQCVTVSEAALQTMRAGATHGLQVKRGGSNSLVELSLIQNPRLDPGFHLLASAFRMFRQHTNPELSFPLLNLMSSLPPKHYWPGPLGVLLQRLHDIAWHWESDGIVVDHDQLRWHVFDTPIQAFELRLKQAWHIRAGAIAAQRPSF